MKIKAIRRKQPLSLCFLLYLLYVIRALSQVKIISLLNACYNFKNCMISKVHKGVNTDRQMNRKEIFSLNRKNWSRIIQQSDQAQFNISQDHMRIKFNQESDSGYKTIIDTFIRMKYQVRDPIELISMLDVDNIVGIHRGLMGLNSLGYSIITRENELEVFNSNIIPLIRQIICQHNNTLLYKLSLNILNKIAERATPQIFPIYFNPNTFSQTTFLHLLDVDNDVIFSQAMILLRAAKKNSYLISAQDDNIHFLDEIQQRIATKDYQISKIKKINRLLDMLDIEFWWNRRRFTNKFYQIKHTILDFFVKDNELLQVNSILRFICQQEQIDKIFGNVGQVCPSELKSVQIFMKKVSSLPFQLKFHQKISCLTQMVIILINYDSSFYISQEKIFQSTIQILLEQSNSEALHSCLIIIRKLILTAKESLVAKMYRKQQMFLKFQQLYSRHLKDVIKELNKIICLMINKDGKKLDLLLSHSLIRLYFERCNAFDKYTARSALQEMQKTFSKIKMSNSQLFQVLKKQIMTQKTKSTLKSIKTYNSTAKTSEYCDYFLSMWKPREIDIVSLSEKESSQVKVLSDSSEEVNQIVIVLDSENDDS